MTADTTLPVCPTCGSSAKQCVRPSAHGAQNWHVEREDLLALSCRCAEVCLPWLERRNKAVPA